MSYDAGFATVSSTSSYYTTSGSVIQDSTFDYTGYAGGAYLPYYAGVPTNPRFIYPFQFTDEVETFSQEVRLVSKADPANKFDYVIGAYYENTTSHGDWFVTNPGSPQYSVAQGCTGYPPSGPPAYPNCLVLSGPNDLTFQQLDTQQFQDKLGVRRAHVSPDAAHSDYDRCAALQPDLHRLPALPGFLVPVLTCRQSRTTRPPRRLSARRMPPGSSRIEQYLYALWSQGFRRGGANSVPASGPFQESPLLRNYAPDSTNNYETGSRDGSRTAYLLRVHRLLDRLGQPADLMEPALGKPCRVQREYGALARLRTRVERAAAHARPELLGGLRLRRCNAGERLSRSPRTMVSA